MWSTYSSSTPLNSSLEEHGPREPVGGGVPMGPARGRGRGQAVQHLGGHPQAGRGSPSRPPARGSYCAMHADAFYSGGVPRHLPGRSFTWMKIYVGNRLNPTSEIRGGDAISWG